VTIRLTYYVYGVSRIVTLLCPRNRITE